MALLLVKSLCYISFHLTKYLLFRLLRFCFGLIQCVWWKINGTSVLIEASKHPDNYAKSAQVMKIRGRCKFDYLHGLSLNDFILTHEDFIHPEYVIAKDETLLFVIDGDKVIFTDAPKGELWWQSQYDAFVGIAQFHHSSRLIIMPLAAFHRVSEQLPDPKAPIAFLACTGRCGSTLLSQVYEMTDRVVAYSESLAIISLSLAYFKKGDCSETRQLTRSVMRHLCRPLEAIPEPVCYAIKPTAAASCVAKLIKEMYPDQAVLFYLYRDMVKVSTSLYRLSWRFPLVRLVYVLGRVSSKFVQQGYAMTNMNLLKGTHVQRFQDDLTCGAYLGAVGTNIYHELRREGVPFYGVDFGEFLKTPELGTRAIFKLSRVDEALVKPGLRAMERDSQANSFVSKVVLDKVPQLTPSAEDKARTSECLVKLGYPPIEEHLKLDGTIDFESIISE